MSAALTTRRRLARDLSPAQFDGLHSALDKVRSASRTVTVEKDALAALLRDHATILEILKVEA